LVLLIVQRLDSGGGGAVTTLSTHRTMANFGQQISGLLTYAVWPELTAFHALYQRDSLLRVHLSLMKFNLWLVGTAAFCALPFIPLIYPLWTTRKLALDPWVLGLLLVRLMLWASWTPSLTTLLAINRHYRAAVALLGEAILALGLAVMLVPRTGIRG